MALHSHRTLPEQAGEPIDLAQCLTGCSVVRRRELIGAYWIAAQRAAEYQVLVAETDFLDQLVPVALERRSEPLGAEAMLWLRAAELAAEADLLAAQLELLNAQFQLTEHAGRPLNSAWLLPATAPRSAPTGPGLDPLGDGADAPWPLRRMAAVTAALGESLQDRAAAVVEADTARAADAAAYQAGSQPIDQAMASIRRQTQETLAFLDTLAQYSQAMADCVLAAVPATIPGDQLATVLEATP